MQLISREGVVVPLGYGFSPGWSTDGSWIMYYADSQDSLNAEIYALNPAEGRLLNLTRNAANDWRPAWSPDGTTIDFVTSREGKAELYLMQNCLIVTGSCDRKLRRVTYYHGNDLSPS